jgi:outer membrane protein OmpA-like peptidoglycan-associated protein
MENKVMEGLECSKCNAKLSPEELKDDKIAICKKCQSKRNNKIATIALIAAVSIGVLSSFYFKDHKELLGFDGVKITDSTAVKQKLISLEADAATSVAPKIENIGETITDIESFKREMETSKLIPSIGVLYSLNNYNLASSSKSLLDYFVNKYNESKSSNVFLIEGYTCDLGSDEVNNLISKERAEVVKNYLISEGIAESKIEVKWYGKNQFKTGSNVDQNRIEQRRSNISIVKTENAK